MAVHFHEEDLPAGRAVRGRVRSPSIPRPWAWLPGRDRLCLVQLSDGKGDEHLVRFDRGSDYAAPNLKALLGDPESPEALSFRALRRRHHAAPISASWRRRSIARAPPRGWSAPIPTATASRTWSRSCSASTCRKQQQTSDWGARRDQRRAARICGERRPLSSSAQGEARRAARARGPHGARPGLLRFPSRAGPARSRRLARTGHFRA